MERNISLILKLQAWGVGGVYEDSQVGVYEDKYIKSNCNSQTKKHHEISFEWLLGVYKDNFYNIISNMAIKLLLGGGWLTFTTYDQIWPDQKYYWMVGGCLWG